MPDDQSIVDAILAGDAQSLFRLLRQIDQLRAGSDSAAWLTEQLSCKLMEDLRPHEILLPRVKQLLQLCGSRLATRPDICFHYEHPIIALFSTLLDFIRVWEPPSGRLNNKLPEWLDNCCSRIPAIDLNDRVAVQALSESFGSLQREMLQRSQRLEQRLLEIEQRSSGVEAAQHAVLYFLNQRLAHKYLPQDLDAFITTTLVGDLQFLVINQGIESPQWKQWKRLLQVLSWSYAGADPRAQLPELELTSWRRKLHTLLPPLLESLDASYYRGFNNQHGYDQFLGDLSRSFMHLLQAKPLQCAKFQPLLDQTAATTILDQSMLDGLQTIREGDWFRFRQADQRWLRSQLILKQANKDLLLFTGFHSDALRYSFEEFTTALALKLSERIPAGNLYRDCTRDVATRLVAEASKLQNRKQDEAEAAALRRSAEKAQREAALLEQKTRLQPIAVDSKQRNKLEQELQNLNSGAWLLLRQPNDQYNRIKLSVKLAALEKYVFTDRAGHKIAEFKLEELVQLMAANRLQVLTQGKDFESSLEKVVRGLRKTN